jgi:molecular chaperone DnaK (HSP70)
MNYTIGIDFGSEYSRISVYKDTMVEIIVNDLGKRKTPSYISFTENEILLGDYAKN